MTNNEAKQKYLQLFVMIMEDAAEESGIPEYRELDTVFGENNLKIINASRQKEIFEDDAVPFEIFILLLIIRVVIRLVGDDPEKFGKITNLEERVEDIFQRYLLVPTHKFTSKYGLPTIKKIWNKEVEIKLLYEKLSDN